MANKKLANEQLDQLKKLVMEGKTPEDISKHFKIAVSSVHNYKRMLKEKGLVIPDVRGKRPTGNTPETLPMIASPIVSGKAMTLDPSIEDFEGYIKLVINNMTIYVAPGASIKTLKGDVLVISC